MTKTTTTYPVATAIAIATHIATQDRFESGAPLAGTLARTRLADDARQLAERIHEMYRPTTVEWHPCNCNGVGNCNHPEEMVVHRYKQNPLLKVLANQLVQLETELGKFAPERPTTEDHSLRRSGWAFDPEADRIDATDEELGQEIDSATAESARLRFKLHAARKSTINRVELAKARLIPSFSWKAAWAATKTLMQECGKEARDEDSWARQCERELRLRAYQRENDATFGVECDSDYQLPTEDSECRRLADEEGRDYRKMSESSKGCVVREGSTPRQVPADHSGLDALEVAYLASDLYDALMGIDRYQVIPPWAL